ncbi:MAG: hypothetical protein R3362_02970 [Rhodothermales bacterium]|nr:hypothetical protein [Rhodothermales bacterium]
MPDLSIGHLFSRSWPVFKAHLGLVVGVFLVVTLLTNLGNNDGPATGESMGDNVLSLISFVIAGPLLAGGYAILLRLHRGEPTSFSELFDGFQEFGRAFGVYALYVIAVFVGLLLLVVPGIVLAVGLWPAFFLVMEDDLGVVDTLREAWELTRGYRGQLFLLGVVLFLFVLLGLLALIIGIVFTGAFAMLVTAAAYDELAPVGVAGPEAERAVD